MLQVEEIAMCNKVEDTVSVIIQMIGVAHVCANLQQRLSKERDIANHRV